MSSAIVCLANSRKMSGRCIPGKELMADGRPGGWVRPVSDRENEECRKMNASTRHRIGSDPHVLDVIDVSCSQLRDTIEELPTGKLAEA